VQPDAGRRDLPVGNAAAPRAPTAQWDQPRWLVSPAGRWCRGFRLPAWHSAYRFSRGTGSTALTGNFFSFQGLNHPTGRKLTESSPRYSQPAVATTVGQTQETRTHSTLTGTQQGARALDNGDERRGRRNGQYLGFLFSELAKDSTRSTRCI
jgi:hypothetical protein